MSSFEFHNQEVNPEARTPRNRFCNAAVPSHPAVRRLVSLPWFNQSVRSTFNYFSPTQVSRGLNRKLAYMLHCAQHKRSVSFYKVKLCVCAPISSFHWDEALPLTLHPILFTDPRSACVTVSLMLTALEPVLQTQGSFELIANIIDMLTMLMLTCWCLVI